MGAPRVGIITVGDEILDGRIVNTNASWLAATLAAQGFDLPFHLSVGDAPGQLAGVLLSPPSPVEALLITGGLGPTEDDRTRSEMAQAAGVSLELREPAWSHIQEYLQKRGVHPVASNRRQAYFPHGAVEIPNPFGSAPAFLLRRGGQSWWALPGVPAELAGLLENPVLAMLKKEHPVAAFEEVEVLRFFGVPESRLDHWLTPQISPSARARLHFRVQQGEVEVRLPPGVSLLEAARQKFGPLCLGLGDTDLATRVVREYQAKGWRIVTVESCTGGLVGARLTSVAGASDIYLGGWVVYSNDFKEQLLGLEPELLAQHGTVSALVAYHLAHQARSRSRAHAAVAITGIAGPGGGSREKPVGTTFLAVAGEAGEYWQRRVFPGDRQRIRSLAASSALLALLCQARGEPPPGWEAGIPSSSSA